GLPRGLELLAAGEAAAEGWLRPGAGDERAVLLVRVPVGATGAEPGGAGERHVAEAQAGDRAAVAAAYVQERLHLRQLDVQAVRVLARGGLVEQLAGGRVQVPLPGLL